MLLIIGNNMGRGKQLSMELTKRSLYSAFLTPQEMIDIYKAEPKKPTRSLNRMDSNSMDYYLELYRTEEESEKPITDPPIAFSRMLLLMPDLGETTAETVISIAKNRITDPLIFVLCEDPSAYFGYMNACHTIFSIEDPDIIVQSIHNQIEKIGINPFKMRYGRLCLYEDEKDGYLYGKKLYLTPAEYKILRFLAFHEGAPFDAESIMAYCFPSTFMRKKCNAITHICHINSKTRKLTHETIIACKKNVGYYSMKK